MFSRTPVWLALWSLALFTTALLLNTRSNTFPYFYHPDESEKAAQLLTGNWNFHHPVLLLTTTKLAVDAGRVVPREQSVVEVGRWISAAFAAAAIVALSLLAYAWRGWMPGIGCGLARWRTGSLWPPVAIHWLMVVVWQTWLGGFSLA